MVLLYVFLVICVKWTDLVDGPKTIDLVAVSAKASAEAVFWDPLHVSGLSLTDNGLNR